MQAEKVCIITQQFRIRKRGSTLGDFCNFLSKK